MKILIIGLISMQLTTCNRDNTSSKTAEDKLTIINAQDDKKKTLLQGVWAVSENENALFMIEGDSIFYTEHQETPVTYKVIGDTFMINYEGLTTKNIIKKLDQDSLIFITEIGVLNKLYKREK